MGSATAKLEAVARASYQHKKTVTEIIPPDVTRAKVGRWLDLISPITEWAGLRGDALRYRRDQLRIQQEAALDELANLIGKKMTDQTVVQRLPPKIIVPALEAASLEEPQSPLIEWWAQLLVSGATGFSIRPYLIDLMKMIGPEEAALLEDLWKYFARDLEQPGMIRLQLEAKIGDLQDKIEEQLLHFPRKEPPKVIFKLFEKWKKETKKWAKDHGIFVMIAFRVEGQSSYEFGVDRSTRNEALDVCCALNILERSSFDERDELWRLQMSSFHFSELGIEFMTACRPATSGAA